MIAADQVFIYNFGSRRARKLNLVSIPPKMYIPNTPDLSILRFDAIFDYKSNMAAHPRLSTANI